MKRQAKTGDELMTLGRRFPRLPASVSAPTGPVRIVVSSLDLTDADSYGHWHELTRTVTINSTLPRWQQWVTLYHELAHVALSDCGMDEMMPSESLEAICDAIAMARFRERFG